MHIATVINIASWKVVIFQQNENSFYKQNIQFLQNICALSKTKTFYERTGTISQNITHQEKSCKGNNVYTNKIMWTLMNLNYQYHQ